MIPEKTVICFCVLGNLDGAGLDLGGAEMVGALAAFSIEVQS